MFRLLFSGLVLVSACLPPAVFSVKQSANNISTVLSNSEARKAAAVIREATVPPGLDPSVFTIRILVAADGTVQDVSNPYSLSDPLFAAAADAARHWYFRNGQGRGKHKGFEAEITFHGPVTGTVTGKDGAPAPGVVVSGSKWTCCPIKRDTVITDESGAFRIEHPGTVLNFFPSDQLQPQSMVVTPKMFKLNVLLEPENSVLTMPLCSKPRSGFKRFGEGKYGLQFDMPNSSAWLSPGCSDVDFFIYDVEPKVGEGRAEFWFGGTAMGLNPDDEQFVESETFATRNVVRRPNALSGSEGGVIGRDTWGRMPNGKGWRQMAVFGEGVVYQDASPESAALFDQVINSACWIEYPKQ